MSKELSLDKKLKKVGNRFAIYGTLRSAMILQRYGKDISSEFNFTGQHFLEGFKMHSYFESYPILVKGSPKDRVVIETAEITSEKVQTWVTRMEMMAGYSLDVVTFDGVDYGVFTQKPEQIVGLRNVGESWVSYKGMLDEQLNLLLGKFIKKKIHRKSKPSLSDLTMERSREEEMDIPDEPF